MPNARWISWYTSSELGAAEWPDLVRSKLYDPTFTHRFRKASESIAHD